MESHENLMESHENIKIIDIFDDRDNDIQSIHLAESSHEYNEIKHLDESIYLHNSSNSSNSSVLNDSIDSICLTSSSTSPIITY